MLHLYYKRFSSHFHVHSSAHHIAYIKRCLATVHVFAQCKYGINYVFVFFFYLLCKYLHVLRLGRLYVMAKRGLDEKAYVSCGSDRLESSSSEFQALRSPRNSASSSSNT
jgi:hypothetical protein